MLRPPQPRRSGSACCPVRASPAGPPRRCGPGWRLTFAFGRADRAEQAEGTEPCIGPSRRKPATATRLMNTRPSTSTTRTAVAGEKPPGRRRPVRSAARSIIAGVIRRSRFSPALAPARSALIICASAFRAPLEPLTSYFDLKKPAGWTRAGGAGRAGRWPGRCQLARVLILSRLRARTP